MCGLYGCLGQELARGCVELAWASKASTNAREVAFSLPSAQRGWLKHSSKCGEQCVCVASRLVAAFEMLAADNAGH